MSILKNDNWQERFTFWDSRISYVKNSKKLSDFRFIVGPEKIVFHAHKFIFASVSPEFENLFYLLEADMKEIVVADISEDIFQEFFNFIYFGKLRLTLENVVEIIKLATLYAITLLSRRCEIFLKEKLNKSNVFKFLDLSTIYELPELEKKCFKIIEGNSKVLIESPELLTVSKKSLEKIVDFEMLSCSEIKVFEAVDKWSEAECERKLIAVTPDNKRLVVGDIILKIRFGEMSLVEFSACAGDNNLLTMKEVFKIMISLADPVSVSEYNLKKRNSSLKLIKLMRYVEEPSKKLHCANRGSWVFNISTDKNIHLYGFGIFQTPAEAFQNYVPTVTMKIEKEDGSLVTKLSEKVIFKEPGIHEIYFPVPILLEKSIPYKVCSQVNGSSSCVYSNYASINGISEFNQNGVVFKISRVPNSQENLAVESKFASFIFNS